MQALYDLESDIGETNDVWASHPDIVSELMAKIAACRLDLGDEAAGIEGQNVRPVGQVENGETLPHYDPEHPYMIALYDMKDRG